MDEIFGTFYDASTDKTVYRPLTEEELVQHNFIVSQIQEEQNLLDKKIADAKSAKEKLAKLGLTENEINAIIGGI
jgi:hypothetical protein